MPTQTHIVCLRFSSLGDVLLQSSFFSMLKKQWGEKVFITFITADEFSGLLKDHPHIDEIKSFSRKEKIGSLFSLFKEIHKKKRVDFIFDLHNTMRSNLLKWRFFSIPRISVDKRKMERKILTSKIKINFLKKETLMERNLKDFDFLWSEIFNHKTLSYFIKEDDPEEGISSVATTFYSEKRLETLKKFHLKNKNYLVLLPSASHETKRWPLESFMVLAKKLLGITKVVILAGPEDHFCEKFNEIGQDNVLNLQGKTSIEESRDIVGGASLCIGNDTGLIHIAEAQRTPVFCLMGPTSEYFGFYPHLKDSQVFSQDLWCRPCSATGSKKCFREEIFCLTKIQVDDVFNKALEVLRA